VVVTLLRKVQNQGPPRRIWVDTIQMDPAEVGCEVVDLIHTAQNSASDGLLGTY